MDGLPSSEVYSTLQDKRGYMWFATDAGVSRFDGYRFTNFSTDHGLSENVIFQLLEDREGRIWCRGMLGTISYLWENSIHKLPVSDELQRAFNGDLSVGMGVDADGTVWISGSLHLFRIPPPYTSFTELRTPNQYRLHTYGATKGHYSPGQGFSLLTKDQSQIPLPPVLGPPNNWLGRFFCHYHDTLKQRHFMAIANTLFLVRENVVKQLYTAPEAILDIEIDPEDRIWLCLHGKGCVVLSDDFSPVEEIRFPVAERFGAVYRDRSDGMWLTTLGSGVYYIPDMHHRQFSLPEPFGPQVNNLVPVGGKICASGYSRAIFLEDTAARKPIEILGIPEQEISSGTGAANGELLVFSKKTYRFRQQMEVFSLLQVESPMKYCASTASGLVYTSGLSYLFRVDKDFGFQHVISLHNQRIQCLYGGRGDTLWIGCTEGLFSYQDDTLIDWQDRLGRRTRINDIAQLTGGELVLGTQTEGLLLFDHRRTRAFTKQDGLSSNLCRSLLAIPGTNRVWVGTNNGICLLACGRTVQIVRTQHSAGGLPLGEIKKMLFASGRLWLASDVGAIVTDTAYQEQQHAFPLYLDSVRLGARTIAVNNPDLPYDSNTIDFHFTGLWYRHAGAIEYRYRLLGLDSNWMSTRERVVHFQSLLPGQYIFELRAFSPDGKSYSALQTVHLSIALPFWKRWWFLGGLIFLTGVMIYAWARNRIRRARRNAEFRQQLAETEIKALRAQMNPHFIFNAINSIQHIMRTGDRETAGRYLSDFSGLLRNVLEQSKSEVITVQHELETLQLYLKIEQLRFGNRFRWEIETAPDLDVTNILITPMLLQPFVENALRHGLTGKTQDGLLRISIRSDPEFLTCVVEDNGIGRAAAAKHGTAQRSRGMQIVRERLEMMRKQYGGQPGFLIEDLYDIHGAPAGTRVTLRLAKYYLS
ncbi:MAG: regulator of cell autolysi [Bacteroidetes bacterium]|nr:MAG: regulator of cell autolysi [Bacteroidota bacterium]